MLKVFDLEQLNLCWQYYFLAFSSFVLLLDSDLQIELREMPKSTFDCNFTALDLSQELSCGQAESDTLLHRLSAIAVHITDLECLEQVLDLILFNSVTTVLD